MPSSAGPNRTASSARAPSAFPNRRVFRQARCGIAPATHRSDRSHRPIATRLKPPSAIPLLRPAVHRTLRKSQDARRSVRARAARLRRRHKKRGAAPLRPSYSVAACCPSLRSSQPPELAAQFARRAEQRILHRFFGGAERVSDRAQLQSLVMLHFKYDAFARREQFHRGCDTHLNFLSKQPAFGVERRPLLPLPLEEIGDAFVVC